MTSMPLYQQIITIALCVLATMATRFLPFLIFSGKRETPAYISYLGNFLPPAVFGMLVVYCLKGISFASPHHWLPEALAVAATALLHLWHKQMLLSIGGGTAFYMLLVHII